MKSSQLLGIALCLVSFVMMLPISLPVPSIIPTKPLDPSLYPLQAQVKTVMVGPTASQDKEMLEGVLRASANIFVLDAQRPASYYKTGEDLKWAIKSIGDISYPLGWKMSERYPSLPGILASHMESRLGTDEVKDREALVRELRNVADVLASI